MLGPDESRQFFQQLADRTKDKPLSLPQIVLSRAGYCDLNNPNKQALSYDGGHIEIVNERRSGVLNAIPIKLSYQLDIYTRYFEEADEYARNFIFNLINYPSLEINIPYQNANIKHKSQITLNPRITDNSNNSGRLAIDQFSRVSINFDINDAYLFSIPIMYNYDVDESSYLIYNDITKKIEE